MKTWMKTAAMFLFVLAACAAPPAAPMGIRITELPGRFVAPESCVRGTRGWLVTDKGCGYDQPCAEDKSTHLGKVVFIGDDGQRKVLLDGLASPNGVTVTARGDVWLVDGGVGDVVVVHPDGSTARAHIEGAKLLNDITAMESTDGVWISDSVTGQIHAAGLLDGQVVTGLYAQVDGAPNGLAASWDGDGVIVAGLGDLKLPGKTGGIRAVGDATPAEYGTCSAWHGGKQQRSLARFGAEKLDGLVPWRRGGERGYLASGIWDTEANKLAAKLWFIRAGGGAQELVLDLAPDIRSAADIGLDARTRTLCVPDLNGSKGLVETGQAGAKVLLVTGLE